MANSANSQENAELSFSRYFQENFWTMYSNYIIIIFIYNIRRNSFMRTDILERKEEILKWIDENKSKAFISKELKCKQETLNRYLIQMGIEYKGNQSGKGMTKKQNKWSLEEYLQNSSDIQTNKVKKKILDEGIKGYKCESCELSTWLNQPIPLELHHIDGNRTNNRIENYQLLCPNCHAFTNSYRGKNSRK